ncbi:MAG: hypothetical protein K1060chlam1_01241 [Candidatus Anoxychlamydiales bacterium]|nr:hypothetical protein [Candidatus Anoxychlamydiales bacterium]
MPSTAPMRPQTLDTIYYAGKAEAIEPNLANNYTVYVRNTIIANSTYQSQIKELAGITDDIAQNTIPFFIKNTESGKVRIAFPLKGRVFTLKLTNKELKTAVKGLFSGSKDEIASLQKTSQDEPFGKEKEPPKPTELKSGSTSRRTSDDDDDEFFSAQSDFEASDDDFPIPKPSLPPSSSSSNTSTIGKSDHTLKSFLVDSDDDLEEKKDKPLPGKRSSISFQLSRDKSIEEQLKNLQRNQKHLETIIETSQRSKKDAKVHQEEIDEIISELYQGLLEITEKVDSVDQEEIKTLKQKVEGLQAQLKKTTSDDQISEALRKEIEENSREYSDALLEITEKANRSELDLQTQIKISISLIELQKQTDQELSEIREKQQELETQIKSTDSFQPLAVRQNGKIPMPSKALVVTAGLISITLLLSNWLPSMLAKPLILT